MAEQSPIPDQLAAVRKRIASLKAEETALRDILLADPSTRIGGDYVAVTREVATSRVANKDLLKADPALFAKLATTSVSVHVRLIRRDGGDEE